MRAIVLSLLAMPLASQAGAQCQLCAPQPKSHTAMVATPLTITIEASLNFSRMTHNGEMGGSATLDPLTGARQLTGDLRDAGGNELVGKAQVEGVPLHPIHIILPAHVTLMAANGMIAQVTQLRTDTPAYAVLDARGQLSFAFGGRLEVTGSALGIFHGRIPITVEYQ